MIHIQPNMDILYYFMIHISELGTIKITTLVYIIFYNACHKLFYNSFCVFHTCISIQFLTVGICLKSQKTFVLLSYP